MAKLVKKYSFLLPQLSRSISTTTRADIRSGGFGQSVTPKVTRIERGRFNWGAKTRWFAPTLREINERRDNVTTDQILRYGAEKIPRRSDFTDWNYSSELYAFQARIGEKFDDLLLTTAFVTPAFLEAELKRQQELGLMIKGDSNTPTSTRSNASLANSGLGIVTQTLRSYLIFALPDLPADGIEAYVKSLTTEKMLAHVSFLIGTKDLLLCEEYPPSEHNMAQTFLALVAALNESSGLERTVRFVLDILATQLHGVDLSEIWNVQNPMNYLTKVLQVKGMAEPESRLLWCSGKETIFSCYHIGIYSNKELIGQAPGETSEIAEEMAAQDALRRIFNIDDSSRPLPFGKYVQDAIPKLVEEKINIKKLSQ